ncbi:hypothetical protein [Geothrix sp.]|jgi:hypothetical protein|uniref:hypothetical protein n=1 Tax=Geothrix sp. TaxID=1962974 RepID=UPI0025C0D879|nr:hypothetical protein [Geothrix sp.]
MRSLLCTLLLLLGSLDCARIYRPVALLAPPVEVQRGELSGRLALLPWGDNSGYARKALDAHLRVAVLSLENASDQGVEVLGLQLPDEAGTLTPEAALLLVRQRSAAYLLYPILPGILAIASGGDRIGQAIFGALGVVGLGTGIPNAVVASRSNRRLGDFFRDEAWVPGSLPPGRSRRGLVFIRSRDPQAPLQVRVLYRGPAGDRRLDLTCPGIPPR